MREENKKWDMGPFSKLILGRVCVEAQPVGPSFETQCAAGMVQEHRENILGQGAVHVHILGNIVVQFDDP